MESIRNLSQYIRVANAILLNRYDEDTIDELIIAILFLLKVDDTRKELLLRFVREKVNRRILQSIENTNNIYAVLITLVHIMNNNNNNEMNNRVTRNNNQQRRNNRINHNNRNRNRNN